MRPNAKIRTIILTCLVTSLAMVIISMPAWARYIRPQLEQTPIDRLIKNLHKHIQSAPENATLHFNLARVHAMAFAAKTTQLPSMRGKPERGAWFGYEPKHVPFAIQETQDTKKQEAAQLQLQQAIKQYQEVIRLKPDHYSAQLGLAWCLEQSGQTKMAIAAYRDTIELGWKKEKSMVAAGLGWHSIVKEASEYLVPLLDAKKDEVEIHRLESRVKHLRRIRRPITPIAIPLRDGMKASDVSAPQHPVLFDADGSGVPTYWNWITPDAGWLVYDRQRTGKITSALQLFGNVTFWCFWDHGYQALASLDNNGDGHLQGMELEGLAIWNDVNQNGISEPGEVKSLADWNIVSLACQFEIDRSHPDRIPVSPHGVTLEDGRNRPTFDILLRRIPAAGGSR